MLQQQDIKIAEDLPNNDEIKNVIKTLKSDKSSSDISPNVLKEIINSKTAQAEVSKLIKLMWETERPPLNFGKSELTALWKRKGCKSDPKNYRAQWDQSSAKR